MHIWAKKSVHAVVVTVSIFSTLCSKLQFKPCNLEQFKAALFILNSDLLFTLGSIEKSFMEIRIIFWNLFISCCYGNTYNVLKFNYLLGIVCTWHWWIDHQYIMRLIYGHQTSHLNMNRLSYYRKSIQARKDCTFDHGCYYLKNIKPNVGGATIPKCWLWLLSRSYY